jgi:SAM-dependent methyltransferase
MPAHQTTDLVPNHHADHPGFTGVPGVLVALTMTVGRGQDADLAVRLTGLQPGDHVVDVGCGPGSAVRRAARSGARATGVDPAPVMLGLARRLTHRRPTARFTEGAAEALPLADGCATVVWSIASVHHWPDLDGGIAEARRVLESGGRLLAVERRSRPGATGLGSHGWTDDQAAAFAERCRGAGFVDVRVEHHDTRLRRLVTVLATRP